jgi:hypothetical protein
MWAALGDRPLDVCSNQEQGTFENTKYALGLGLLQSLFHLVTCLSSPLPFKDTLNSLDFTQGLEMAETKRVIFDKRTDALSHYYTTRT